MKIKVFLLIIFALALVNVGCQQEFNPTGPSLEAVRDSLEYRDARMENQSSLEPSGKPNFSGSSNSSHNSNENHPNNNAKSEFINKIRTSNGELAADILPQKWNVNWTESVEDLKVKIFGEGLETIIPESVSLSNGSLSLTQTGFEKGAVFLQVTFAKRDAITLVNNPVPDAAYEMLVFGTLVGDIAFVLTDTIFLSSNIKTGELAAEIRPGKWNIAWTESQNDVSVKISGLGFSEVVFSSIWMSGLNGEIKPHSFELGGTYFTAFFLQKDAIGLLENPKRDETYEIGIAFTSGITPYSMSYTITINGSKKSGDYAVKISPDKWNVNWVNSTDELSVKISGGDPAAVDAGSVTMTGPNGTVILPSDTEIEDENFHAKFIRKDAIGLLENPQKDDTYEIDIAFDAGGVPYSMSHTITIVGSKKNEEYSIKISPDKWNVNWVDSTVELIVKISGGDPTAVDAGSITMTGPTSTVISPSDTEIKDENFHAKFIRKDAIGLIDSPESGNTYTITINFTSGLQALSFDYSILVNGKKK